MASDLRMTSFWRLSLRFSRSHLTLGQEGTTALGLGISNSLGILQLGPEEDLCLVMLAMSFLSSSICQLRSWFSTWRCFLVDSASLRALAISSSLVLEAAWTSLPCLWSSALPLTASSRSRRASQRWLSFSYLTLLALRLSIWETPPGGSALKRSRSELDSWVCSRSSSCFHASFWKHLPWPCSHAKEHPQLHEELLQAFPLFWIDGCTCPLQPRCSSQSSVSNRCLSFLIEARTPLRQSWWNLPSPLGWATVVEFISWICP